jgi:hypothetical protein
MGRTCSMHGERGMHIGFYIYEAFDVGGRIILKSILEK